MAEHGHRPGLAGEPLGKGRVLADLRREDFQRHQPIEPFLPGLVDHAHAAAAHQFQDLQVREMGRQLGGRGRHEIGDPVTDCSRPFHRSGFPIRL